MTNERRTTDALIAVLEERITGLSWGIHERFDQIRIDLSLQNSSLKDVEQQQRSLVDRERERNGHIADLAHYRVENEQHWAEHMVWASERGAELASMKRQHDNNHLVSQTRAQIVRLILGAVTSGATAAVGLIVFLTQIGVL